MGSLTVSSGNIIKDSFAKTHLLLLSPPNMITNTQACVASVQIFSKVIKQIVEDTRAPCRWGLPPEGLPSITDILVASFEALRAVSDVSQEDHRVHLEGAPPSGWQMTPCERASNKEDAQILSC